MSVHLIRHLDRLMQSENLYKKIGRLAIDILENERNANRSRIEKRFNEGNDKFDLDDIRREWVFAEFIEYANAFIIDADSPEDVASICSTIIEGDGKLMEGFFKRLILSNRSWFVDEYKRTMRDCFVLYATPIELAGNILDSRYDLEFEDISDLEKLEDMSERIDREYDFLEKDYRMKFKSSKTFDEKLALSIRMLYIKMAYEAMNSFLAYAYSTLDGEWFPPALNDEDPVSRKNTVRICHAMKNDLLLEMSDYYQEADELFYSHCRDAFALN